MFQQDLKTIDSGHPNGFRQGCSVHVGALIHVAPDRNKMLKAVDCAQGCSDVDRVPAALSAFVIFVASFLQQKLRDVKSFTRDRVNEWGFAIGVLKIEIDFGKLLQKTKKVEVFVFDRDMCRAQL